jgi:hypothetical protein
VDVPQQPLIPDVFEAPFSRKVTTNFIDSAARIVALIDADTPDSIVNPGEGQSQISANYLDALVELHASSDDGALHVGSTWSLAYPIPTTVPNGVQSPREYFSIIETCAKRLREEMAPTTMRVIGRVDELYGILGDDGHRSGEVLVSFQDDTEVIKATLTLNADAYSIAIGAHETGKFVSLNGTLVRARRKNKILDHSDFKVLE